jgi:predicted acylesterase/phospholipase RssA
MRKLKMKNYISMLMLAACFMCGCQAQKQVKVPFNYGRFFHEASVNIDNYKSVQQRAGVQDPQIAVAVAISGGGHRAGNFGMGVLLGLEGLLRPYQQGGNVLSEVDYFSTVSGGGFAAAAYLSSLHDHQFFARQLQEAKGYSLAGAMSREVKEDKCRCENNKSELGLTEMTDPCLKRHLERNYHDDIVGGLLDVFSEYNRGYHLERAIDDNMFGYCWRQRKLKAIGDETQEHSAGLTLGDMFIRKGSYDEVMLPYWVANATILDNGAIFSFSPDHMELYGVSGYTHRLTDFSKGDREDMWDFISEMPMSVALRASANFPGVIPATTLTCEVQGQELYLHLLDGGLGDNLGVVAALNLLKQDEVQKKVLIVIDAFEAITEPYSVLSKSPGLGSTISRTLMIALDSMRGRDYARLRTSANELAAERPGQVDGVWVIYISFEDLLCPDDQVRGVYDRLVEYDVLYNAGRLAAELEKELGALNEKGDVIIRPYELARSVTTAFKLSVAQQDMLLAAGRYIVNAKQGQIFKSLSWTNE